MDRIEPNELAHQLHSFLSHIHVLSIATVGEQGQPHVTDVYFVANPTIELFFFSNPESVHVQNIERDPRIAATAHATSSMWQKLRGVQIHGVCSRLAEQEKHVLVPLYASKFPNIHELRDLVDEMAFFRIHLKWLRWIDNSVRHDFRVETSWPPESSLSTSVKASGFL